MTSASSSLLVVAALVGCGPAMAATGRCPPEMSLVEGRFCIDRWEAALEAVSDGVARPWSPQLNPGDTPVRAVSRAGAVPQGYVSGRQAEGACELAGKRLCTSREWLAACRGPRGRAFPYGDRFEPGRCNVGRRHPVLRYFGRAGRVFSFINMNNAGINLQRDTVAPAGSFTGCVSPWGVFDLVGNVHEWVADRGGTFRGGFYANDAENSAGCYYATRFHGFTYHDYSTGFRCCADPR